MCASLDPRFGLHKYGACQSGIRPVEAEVPARGSLRVRVHREWAKHPTGELQTGREQRERDKATEREEADDAAASPCAAPVQREVTRLR